MYFIRTYQFCEIIAGKNCAVSTLNIHIFYHAKQQRKNTFDLYITLYIMVAVLLVRQSNIPILWPQINNINRWATWIVFVIELNLWQPCFELLAMYSTSQHLTLSAGTASLHRHIHKACPYMVIQLCRGPVQFCVCCNNPGDIVRKSINCSVKYTQSNPEL